MPAPPPAADGATAEQVAAGVAIPERVYFTTARKLIRDALATDGIARAIDRLVARLLDR